MPTHRHAIPCLLLFAAGLLLTPSLTLAQTPPPVAPATASVSGRVSHAATGQYLNNARVAVQGTNLVAFTDESGTYRLDRVAAGTVVLEVFYTGLEPQTVSLALVPSATMEKDIALVAPPRAGASGAVVKLGSFVVSDSREMDGAAIAINEQRVGQLSVGAFRRDFSNFFGNTVLDATPAFLALYGLEPTVYDPYDVVTQFNLSTRVRMEGYNVNYRQALTFLPSWARGVQFYANGSAQRATGDGAANFAGYFPKSGSWGISLSRPKFNTRLNWNYLSRQRRNAVSGRSLEPGTYNWGSKRSYIDVSGEYSLTRRLALFANLRNINKPVDDVEIAGPNTPAHAQLRQRQDFGSLWTIGVKGSF